MVKNNLIQPITRKECRQKEWKESDQQQQTTRYKRVHFPEEPEMEKIKYYQPEKDRKRRRKKPRGKKIRKIILLYANINGVKGKIKSLETAVKASNCDIVMITETKGRPPQMEGFKWYHKERISTTGGGVAIGIRDEIAKYTGEIKDMEDQNQEIIWIESQIPGNSKLYLGCYYGPQEREKREEVERQYSQIETQIHRLQQQGSVILGGDFNAKLEVSKQGAMQQESRNGHILSKLIEKTSMVPINLESTTGMWTRVNKNRDEEKTIIDYILTCPRTT